MNTVEISAAQKTVLAAIASATTRCACVEGRAALSVAPLARAGLIEIVEAIKAPYFARGLNRFDVVYSVRLTDAGRAAL